jgi:hypothetical protein
MGLIEFIYDFFKGLYEIFLHLLGWLFLISLVVLYLLILDNPGGKLDLFLSIIGVLIIIVVVIGVVVGTICIIADIGNSR